MEPFYAAKTNKIFYIQWNIIFVLRQRVHEAQLCRYQAVFLQNGAEAARM